MTVKQLWIVGLHMMATLDAVLAFMPRAKYHFEPVHGLHYAASVLLSDRVPATVRQCTRACRLYADCWGFNMQWENDTSGFCQYTGLNRGANITDTGYSFYGTYE